MLILTFVATEKIPFNINKKDNGIEIKGVRLISNEFLNDITSTIFLHKSKIIGYEIMNIKSNTELTSNIIFYMTNYSLEIRCNNKVNEKLFKKIYNVLK